MLMLAYLLHLLFSSITRLRCILVFSRKGRDCCTVNGLMSILITCWVNDEYSTQFSYEDGNERLKANLDVLIFGYWLWLYCWCITQSNWAKDNGNNYRIIANSIRLNAKTKKPKKENLKRIKTVVRTMRRFNVIMIYAYVVWNNSRWFLYCSVAGFIYRYSVAYYSQL